ncbi:MAG TPA: MazG nucleotide pyrophosphohydrolase domain-containing protein, partial [Solirubrobacteraceae bacterium]|nr:MazG nucleotide pyrophosphohydrolase domain-containing protein [Solirubrobacteraceae bacterium]
DELGDVLFQVHFLALLLEERGAGDLAAVAEHCRQKLIRRHPHVFGDVAADSAGPEGRRSATLSAGEVLRNWDQIKVGEEGREPGIFGDVPENLPALLYARKVQRRAASAGRWPASGDEQADEESFRAVGDELLALVDRARKQRVDPELALRAAADRFRGEIGER